MKDMGGCLFVGMLFFILLAVLIAAFESCWINLNPWADC